MIDLRQRAPELVLEAVFVVLAVMVALAVDEWWEGREEADLADSALLAIRAEIESNRDEVLDGAASNDSLLVSVLAAAADTVLPVEFDLNYEYSLLSAAGWETAQVTRATQFIPIERVQSLARLYGLQELFQTSQDQVLSFILQAGELAEGDPASIPRRIRGRLSNAVQMGHLLVSAYDSTLVEMDRSGITGR